MFKKTAFIFTAVVGTLSALPAHALYGTSIRWPAGNIPVCWETGLEEETRTGDPNPASSAPNFETYSAWLREAVENSWGRAANLRFLYWGDCPSRNHRALAGWVSIVWSDRDLTSIGYRSDDWTRMGLRRPADTSEASRRSFQATVRHEMGHAIGFFHELDRPDAPHRPGGDDSTCDYGASIPGTYWTPNDPPSIMNYSYCQAASAGVLSPMDIMGIQAIYGRKATGSLVGLGGRCVNIPEGVSTYGVQTIAYDCYGVSNDTWRRTADKLASLVAPDHCLDVQSFPPAPFGTPVDTDTCGTGGFEPQITWSFDSKEWRAIGNLCVAAASASTSAPLTVQTCNGSALQKWDFESIGRVRLSGTGYCANVAYGSTADGTPLGLYPCGSPRPWPNEVFTFSSRGEMQYGGKCLNVANGYPVPGSSLVIYSCNPGSYAYPNEQFYLSGTFISSAQCLDMTSGRSSNGVPIEVYPCVDGAPNQVWDYYFGAL